MRKLLVMILIAAFLFTPQNARAIAPSATWIRHPYGQTLTTTQWSVLTGFDVIKSGVYSYSADGWLTTGYSGAILITGYCNNSKGKMVSLLLVEPNGTQDMAIASQQIIIPINVITSGNVIILWRADSYTLLSCSLLAQAVE